MCGIAAMFCTGGIKEKDRILLQNMSGRMKHRGPDGEGYFYTAHTGMAHRRLSIIDPTEHGSQPMTYKENYTIVFNGEIYNYIEIKRELLKKGYTFRSDCDTEVLLAAYDCYGVNCLEKLNGMWAFVLLDRAKNELVISRDRFGVKPLYFYKSAAYFLLASEIKALLCDERIERIANDEMVFDFLADGLLEHTNATFYDGIEKVPPGTYAVIDLKNPGIWEFHSYYSIQFAKADEAMKEKKAVLEFRRLFQDAVAKRLRADVLVGTCLSGGLDSSAIALAVNRIYRKRFKQQHSFSFVPQNKKLNEKRYVDAVLKRTQIKPHYISDSESDMREAFEKLIDAQDEPFISMSMLAGYLVYQKAAENHIKVLLDGQGADEMLCGYRKSRIYYIKELARKHDYWKAAKEFLLSFSQIRTTGSVKSDVRKILKIWNKAEGTYANRYLLESFTKGRRSKNMYSDKNFQDINVKQISLPALLRYADRNSMAVSVESRLPFLDYRLADFCAKIPVSMKIKNGYSKYIMRQALELPPEIRRRKSKYGFFVPEKMWLLEYADYFKGYFEPGRFRAGKYIHNKKVLRDWNCLVKGMDEGLLFRMLSVAAWMEHFQVKTL